MTAQTVIFYAFAAILVFAALRVITSRNPVHSALWLVLSFFSSAGVWMLLQAEFLAIALVLVYVGAVMVLFLFVVMMLDVNFDKMREGFRGYIPVGATVGFLILVEMALALIGGYLPVGATPSPGQTGPGYSNTSTLGRQLYTDYAFPFEIAAVILLVAIIAAIALTHRTRRETKYQNPNEQVRVGQSGGVQAADDHRPADVGNRRQPPTTPIGPVAAGCGGSLVAAFATDAVALSGLGQSCSPSASSAFFNRRNVIIMLMAIELILLAVNLNFIAFSYYLDDTAGQIFVFFILTVAAAESAIGLAILVLLFRSVGSIDVEDLRTLRG
jgi:NADH-quinone oxidoreductase subunit J